MGAFSRYCEISQSPVGRSLGIAQYSILSAPCLGKLYSLAASRCDSYLPYMLVGHENNRTVCTVKSVIILIDWITLKMNIITMFLVNGIYEQNFYV